MRQRSLALYMTHHNAEAIILVVVANYWSQGLEEFI